MDKLKDLPFYEWKEFSKQNALNYNAWYTYGCFGLLGVMCFSKDQLFRIIGMLTIMLFVLGYAMIDYFNLKKKFLEANKVVEDGNN